MADVTLSRDTKITLGSAIAVVAMLAAALTAFLRVEFALRALQDNQYTISQAVDQAHALAVENAHLSLRVPHPRDPSRVIVVRSSPMRSANPEP